MSSGLTYAAFMFESPILHHNQPHMLRFLLQLVHSTTWRVQSPFGTDQHILEHTPDVLAAAWDTTFRDAAHGGSLDLLDLGTGIGAQIGIDFAHQARKLLVMIDPSWLSELVPQATDRMRSYITLCKHVYTALHPAYGYGFTSPNHVPLAQYHDVTSRVYALYDYNFFGPRPVDVLGRENVRSITTSRTQVFEDGGVLLEMMPYPAINYQTYTPQYASAIHRLGLPKFQQG